MADVVVCCNCGFRGCVKAGEESCPACGKSGCLAWADEKNQECNCGADDESDHTDLCPAYSYYLRED